MKSSTHTHTHTTFLPLAAFVPFCTLLIVGVSVLDVDVFLSSHAEMSAFRGRQGRKVPDFTTWLNCPVMEKYC